MYYVMANTKDVIICEEETPVNGFILVGVKDTQHAAEAFAAECCEKWFAW